MTRGFRDEDSAERSDLVDVTATFCGVSKSGAAWLLEQDEAREWVPVSQVERDGNVFTMPRWLADEKGFS